MITGEDIALLKDHIDNCAKEGLRTLVLAYKKLSLKEYDQFKVKFNEA